MDLDTLSQKCRSCLEEVAAHLIRRQWRLAAAESCTGGWLSKCCTDIPGSSVWFGGGVVCYSDDAKREFLRVRRGTIECHGAISEEVVREMVIGLLLPSIAQVGVAISGIAGPHGGSKEKPVGTVCFAWRTVLGDDRVGRVHFEGDREAIRLQSIHHAASGVRKVLERTQ